ncbi:MmgE/PrpD family protein [Roseomonas sp. GC11]|uniref:MmgE/PrpD family protein n=1 Tax=Roseomonas sp. GC11 TaxID=2950546 RepID=UPI0021094671|nr:MmgE/PrpD family protein [Roseomonas sp. GC11]MCQ4160200.1 MmgE/PrpD family protein [Roseomonas sp. GC11]
MNIVTAGVEPASVLLRRQRPEWLEEWGRFAASFSFADLPEEARDRTRLVLLDSIGVIAAGMQEPELASLLRQPTYAAGGTAIAIGAGHTLPPLLAAFANGTAGTMLELDEGNQYARGHPAIHVVPAALAAAPRDGAALLGAMALGYELGARIGIASKLRVTMHPHGTWGTLGAFLSVAHLRGADAQQIMQGINLASSLGLSTSRRTMLEGATVRNTYAGFSNQLGLMAWDLVAAGFTGETDGVGAVYGGIIAEDFQPSAMTDSLGVRWEIARNYFKRHAACRYTHGALDALGMLRARLPGLRVEDIAAISVETYVWAAQLDLPAPANMLSAKFSIPFALATALVHGEASVPAFRPPALQDPAIRDLAARVTVREDLALTAQLPGLRPARVAMTLRDGSVHQAEVLTNRGDTEDPYEAADIIAKFRSLAVPVWGEAGSTALLDAALEVDQAGGLDRLFSLLALPPRSMN